MTIRDAPPTKRTKADPLALREGRDTLTPEAKLVGHTLAMRMDAEGDCFPSLTRLEADTGLSRTTVCLSLNELEEKGRLIRERTDDGKSATRYRAALPGVVRPADWGSTPGGLGVVRPAYPNTTGVTTNPDDAGAHAHEGFDHEGFAEACGGLTPQGLQVERWRTAFTESPDGFRSLVAQSGSKRTPEAWLDAAVKRGGHREVVALDAKLSPLDRATRYVSASGWQLTDADLAEVLGQPPYEIEGPAKHQLIATARTLRATREAA
jgi:hypothetical protein